VALADAAIPSEELTLSHAFSFLFCEELALEIDTIDCQPSGPQDGILVFVSGTIALGPNEHLLMFSQACAHLPADK
jgi:hypothetical protein